MAILIFIGNSSIVIFIYFYNLLLIYKFECTEFVFNDCNVYTMFGYDSTFAIFYINMQKHLQYYANIFLLTCTCICSALLNKSLHPHILRKSSLIGLWIIRLFFELANDFHRGFD